MVTLPITTLTPSAVQQNLQADGLDTLGLTTFSVSPRWADAAVSLGDYDSGALTLNIPSVRLPYRGILEYGFTVVSSNLTANLSPTDLTFTVKAGDGAAFPTPTASGSILLTLFSIASSKYEVVACTARVGDTFTVTRAADDTAAQAFKIGDPVILRLSAGTRTDSFYGVDCVPFSGPSAIYRLHPQAVLRLSTLAKDRYVTGTNPPLLPIPFAMVVRGVEGFTTARWYEADELLGAGGTVSFHDSRGLILDPVYVACMFSDLQNWLAGLLPKSPVASSVAGGVQTIAGLSSTILVHCVDLHGAVYQPAIPGATLVTQNASLAQTGVVPASGLFTLAAGDGIACAATDNNRLRWGWETNGVLARNRLAPPALTNPLAQQFYRAAIVDTTWALLGNRTASAALGVDPDDQTIPADMLPLVRDQVVIDYLADGPDMLAQSNMVMNRSNQNMVLTVSPVISNTMAVPSSIGAAAHWPTFPAPNSATGFPTPLASPATGITAAWASGGGGNDVVVTIVAGTAPEGAHVRIYPQLYVTIAAITADAPSFLRGDGGAAIAHDGAPTQIFLANPFHLVAAQPRPSPANLTLDIVVMPRNGTRKLWGAVTANVAAGPVPPSVDPFAGTSVVALVPPIFEAVAPVPLFGIPTTVTPPGAAPGGLIAFLRALASEGSSPRQGPRLPTMARFETIVVSGTNGGTPANTLLWEAVLSGGRWDTDTRSARHSDGNPGNPAGPDVHAPGIHVTGALAYDLARHAMRRAQPIIPLPGSPTPGWLVAMDGANFDVPTDSTATNTGIGVLLETTPAICETPELSVITPPPPGATVQNLVNNLASTLGVSAPTVNLGPTEPRMEQEVRREVIVSTSGLRDSLWSLHRALHDARELIYIESPQFARTAYPAGAPKPQEIDLVDGILKALLFRPNLRLIVCTPRESDFAANYKGWSRQHYRARNDAVSTLLASVPDRVAIFHPVGFPGRSASVRTTTVVVDDVWCLTGATHMRRRGMTFDGSAAIASFDRQMENGYSKNVRAYRRNLMAAKMAVAAPGAGSPSAEWLRLGHPLSAFQLVTDWLNDGGLGRIQPFWPGPADTTVLPATVDMADPDGSNGSTFIATFASLLAESGD
ncbi:MAG: hypothetical protein ABI035_01830 [Gemmatimonadaceae bacterium]